MIRICIIGFVLVAGQNPILDALPNDAAEVDCSGCADKWFQLRYELVAPSCTLFCGQISEVAGVPERRLATSHD
jgi:hypothetical protein